MGGTAGTGAAGAATATAPLCAPPDPAPRPPARPFPALACDCHAHICGPAARFAYDRNRIYTPPDALLPDYLRLLDVLGLARAVLVQPSVYGTDNRVLLGALKAMGARARGVAVIDANTGADEIAALHAAGVRGARLNLVDVRDREAGLPLEAAARLAERIAPMGWHMEFLVHIDEAPDIDRRLAGFPVDVVFGHLGYMRPGATTDEPGFRALLRLLETGRAWVKLTAPYRISALDAPYADTDPLARALLAAAPDRILWGTDWPHVMVRKPMPNDGLLCDILTRWTAGGDCLARVLVANPAALYGFAGAEG